MKSWGQPHMKQKNNDVPEGRIVVGRTFAEGAVHDKLDTGTVLDYLWVGQQGSVFEPVEPDPLPQQVVATDTGESATVEKAQDPARPCLDSTLKSYSSWLDSIDTE